MLPRSFLILPFVIAGGAVTSELAGQEPLTYVRGPGGYLSLTKLILIAVVFLVWVRLADWMNRQSLRIGDQTNLPPEVWSPITAGTFLLGFLIVISLPIFAIGYPLYLIAALTPFFIYFFMRRAKLLAKPDLIEQLKLKPGEEPPAAPLPQDLGAAFDFTPAGEDNQKRQVNLIRARQSFGFPILKDLMAAALVKRADMILLDYTQQQVNVRIQVDGVWHPLPPMDRESGDAVLYSLKNLAGLNAAERRAKQTGTFNLKNEHGKAAVELLTQGVATGERAQVKFRRTIKGVLTLGQLGMFPKMIEQLSGSLNHAGLSIVSCPPGEGLTSSWRGTLATADRMTRDCVAVIPVSEIETNVENIIIKTYDGSTGNTQADVLRGTILSQPDFLAIPIVENGEIMDVLTAQVNSQGRTVLLRTPAKSAAEGLLRMYSVAEDRAGFANAVKYVTGQRLIRRLCDTCKQETRVPPHSIQQLGGDPKKQQTVFNPYRLPPPEQRVDEKGNEIEFPPCETCGGIGYLGRIAVYELLTVNEQVRAALLKTPKVDAIEAVALKTGKKTLPQQAYQLVLLGITSIAEVQRVFKPPTKS